MELGKFEELPSGFVSLATFLPDDLRFPSISNKLKFQFSECDTELFEKRR